MKTAVFIVQAGTFAGEKVHNFMVVPSCEKDLMESFCVEDQESMLATVCEVLSVESLTFN